MRGGEKKMKHRLMITGLIAAFVLSLGGAGLGISPAGAAEMMEADMGMMKATAMDLMALKQEIWAIQAELQRLAARTGSMTKMMDKATSDYCASVPEALLVSGFAPGLCR
jgi:uncharacterized protein with von Willebrand factor type A (vWA) domain